MAQEAPAPKITLTAWLKLLQLAASTGKPQVSNAALMFQGMNVDEINGSQLDMTQCVSTNQMCAGCTNLTRIVGTADWGFRHLVNAYGMFSGCTHLREIEGMGNWNMHNLVCMDNMFKNTALETVDMSHWDLSNLKSATDCFNASTMKYLIGNGAALKYVFRAVNSSSYLQGIFAASGKTYEDSKIYKIDYTQIIEDGIPTITIVGSLQV